MYIMVQVQVGSSCNIDIRLAQYDLQTPRSSSMEVHTKLVADQLVLVFSVLCSRSERAAPFGSNVPTSYSKSISCITFLNVHVH